MPTLPINVYGNVDVRHGLPPGFTHVPGKRLTVTCKSIGVSCAPALIGFKKGYFGQQPDIDGVVVTSEDAPKLLDAIKRKNKRRPSPEQQAERRQKRQHDEAEQFAEAIAERFPSMPASDMKTCAQHATEIGSRRVGRSSDVEDPVLAAVVAYIRHQYTNYEDLLEDGVDRDEARGLVAGNVRDRIEKWSAFTTSA